MENESLSRIFFAGTPVFAAIILKHLHLAHLPIAGVYTQPDKPAGRGLKLQMSPVKQLALEYQLPVYQPASLRLPEEQHKLSALAPDLLIVAAYGLILPQAVLDMPKLGCVNVHPSLLPRWRGAAPIVRTIEAGDEKTGVTLMQMDAGLDTGGMISVSPCPILAADTSQTLHDRLAELGGEVLVELLKKAQEGMHWTSIAQPEQGVTYAHKISKSEARIDWTKSALELDRLVRAFNPYPGAYTCFNELDHLKIWEACCVATQTSASATSPGDILNIDRLGIDVATGEGVLRIQRLQLPGSKPVLAADFLNSHAVVVGKDRFSEKRSE